MNNEQDKERRIFSAECPYCALEMGWRYLPNLRQVVRCEACRGTSTVSLLDPIELMEALPEVSRQSKICNKGGPLRNASYLELMEEETLDFDGPTWKLKKKRSRRRNHRKNQPWLNWG